MLINIRISELQSNTSNSIPLAIAIAISFNYPIFQLLPYNIAILNNYYNLNNILYNISLNQDNKKVDLNTSNDDIHFVTSKIWDGAIVENSDITSIGNVLYTNYNIWLLLASFILLLAMVGAITISLKNGSSGRGNHNLNKSVKRSFSTLAINRTNTSYKPEHSLSCAVYTRCLSTFSGPRLNEDSLTSRKLSDNPWFWTGFTDAEGCFSVSLSKNSKLNIGWRVKLVFSIAIHKKDKALLEKLLDYLGVGYVNDQKSRSLVDYRVTSLKDLPTIIAHFDKYPLISQKKADFELFKRGFEIVKTGGHLTPEGLNEIVSIKASMNTGLSEKLKEAFPQLALVIRPVNINPVVPDPQWLAGFTSGDGNFLIGIGKSEVKAGFNARLIFTLTQHARDGQLMVNISKYLDCGTIVRQNLEDAVYVKVTKFSDILEKVIPFFQKNLIQGVKNEDFLDFCKVAELIKNKVHLTEEGLKEIRLIKDGTNRGRKIEISEIKL